MPLTAAQSSTLAAHLEAEDRHDAAQAASTYVDDSSYENAALALTFDGKAMVEFQYAASYDLISEMRAEYLWQHEGNDVVVQVGRIRGQVAPGDMLGVPAAGGYVDFPFTAIVRFAGAQMKAEHIFYELSVFCEQAGIDEPELRVALERVRAGSPTP